MSDQVVHLAFQRRSRYRVERFDDIRPSTSSYLVKGLYPRTGLAFITGQSKAGKTFVTIDHTLKIASGAKVMGRNAKHSGVIYVAAEDPEGCRARIEAWKKKNPRESYTPFALIGQPVDLNSDDSVDDLKGAIRDAIDGFAEHDFGLGAIVFDTLARCVPGADENSSADMGRALQAIESFANTFECLAMIVAHHGKNAAAGIRGWSGLGAAADAVVTVVRDDETKERTLTLDKVKNGPDGDRIAFSLLPAPIGIFDEDGEEVWSCTVNYEGMADKIAKPARRVALKPQEEILLSAIRWVTDNGSTQDVPASVIGIRAGTKAIRRDDAYARAEEAGLAAEGETYDAFKKRRRRALEALVAAKRIRLEGDLIWLV